MRLYGGVRMLDRPSIPNIRRLDAGAMPMIQAMNSNGIRIDPAHFSRLDARLAEVEEACRIEIRTLMRGEVEWPEFNPASPDQVAELLFVRLGLRPPGRPRKTQRGRFTTDDDMLAALKPLHPIAGAVADFREIRKLRTTYTGPIPKSVGRDGRLRTIFKATRTATGRLASGDKRRGYINCFDVETEVLTDQGWRRISDLLGCWRTTRVAQWHDGVIDFVYPTAFVSGTARSIVRISNGHIDLCVTEDHRCLLSTGTGKYKTVPALSYPTDPGSYWMQLNAGCWAGGEGVGLSAEQLQFLVAVQADGSWVKGKKGFTGALDFCFRKSRKIDRIRFLLKSLAIKYTEREGSQRFRFYVPRQDGTAYAERLLGFGKRFGPWVLKASRYEADVIIREIFFWDGCWTRKNHYASQDKQNSDFIQALFILSGVRANIRRYTNSAGSISYQVDATQRNYSMTANAKKEILPGAAPVFCLSVPSSFIVTRRNGKVSITGQCQNIPVRGEWGREIRNGFVASDGCVLVSHDLSQIEMRDAAHLSGDPAMARIFRDGLDIHTFTAIALFKLAAGDILDLIARDAAGTATEQDKVALAEFRHRYRLPAKTCGFGILYGLTAEGLQTRIMADGGPVLDVAECQRYIDGWFAAYPAIKKWMELQYYRARRYGMVWDLFGRIRPTPGVHSAITRVQEEALREAGNMPIQSTAQGHIKLAMAEFMPLVEYYESRGETCRPILQVHDELIHEVGEGIADEFCAMGQEIMRRSVPLDVPVESSADKAHSWGAMK